MSEGAIKKPGLVGTNLSGAKRIQKFFGLYSIAHRWRRQQQNEGTNGSNSVACIAYAGIDPRSRRHGNQSSKDGGILPNALRQAAPAFQEPQGPGTGRPPN